MTEKYRFTKLNFFFRLYLITTHGEFWFRLGSNFNLKGFSDRRDREELEVANTDRVNRNIVTKGLLNKKFP